MKELKFIHITKCAGTFIEDIGIMNNIKWGRYHKEYGWWHGSFVDKPKLLKNKYDWFMVVRNPYTRILSEYYCEWGGIGKKNIVHTKEEFNNFLINKINNRNKVGWYDHYTEQYKYIDNRYNIYIVKFENLYNDLKKLFTKYNIIIDLTNYTKKINNKESMNKNIIFTINDFSDELLELINSVYHNDFIMFNYEKIKR